jgi:hypothetical protein
MHYETLLFTRNQRLDFTVFVRPAALTNKDVSTIGAVFNYITDVSRLTAQFPSLYAFPLSEYLMLLRHYNSGRRHAGRAIGVIEGITVPKTGGDDFTAALAHFVTRQADLLDLSATIPDIEEAETMPSPQHTWDGHALDALDDSFVGEFLARRQKDRLFLPFTTEGRDLLIKALSDPLFTSPPFFAFGTNSDVLAQLGKLADIDIVSYFKTERPSYRSRRTNSVSGSVAGFEPTEAAEAKVDPSMSVRPVQQDETRLRPSQAAVDTTRMRRTETDGDADDQEADKETMVGANAMPIHTFSARKPKRGVGYEDDADDAEATMLTMRQMRDKIRAEETAARAAKAQPPQPRDPISRIVRLIASIFSPNNSDKPK